MGRTLGNALLAMGIYDDLNQALDEMGLDLSELMEEENDPGLGNGGLGRLAACFLDSLATLGLPGRGYGIRYDYGMFKQNIVDGQQRESPDYWLEYGNPWEFQRFNTRYKVRFGGRLQHEGSRVRWVETEEIVAMAYDQIIPASTPMPPTRCGCGARRPVTKLTSASSIRATTSRRWKIKPLGERVARALSRRLDLLRARAASAPSIFSSLPRCRISSIATGRCMKPGQRPTKLPSTSTIPIRCWRFLS